MTIAEASKYSTQRLTTIYGEGEARTMSEWMLEHITGSRRTERLGQDKKLLTPDQEATFIQYLERLLAHEPLQYVINESWFAGLRFFVDQRVLIPRPETEELVEWIISDCRFPIDQLSILDIGTGSGCIPIALKRRLGKAVVSSVDISSAALEVAKLNAGRLGVDVDFKQMNILDQENWKALEMVDIIVSNPPYIPENNKAAMDPNVLKYEPGLALFVPDNDALVFYRAIAELGKRKLNRGGAIYLEIHEDLGADSIALFQAAGYQTLLKKDMQGKDRMLRAIS